MCRPPTLDIFRDITSHLIEMNELPVSIVGPYEQLVALIHN